MFIVTIRRLLRGTVFFRAEGTFTGKFLHQLASERISCWNTAQSGDILHGCVAARKYRRVARIARKNGLRIRIVKKKGAPFRLRGYTKRIGIAAGLILFFVFLLVMNRFVWVIEVQGNETVPSELIIRTAEKYGVRIGAAARSIDATYAEHRMMVELESLGWIAVNVENSVVTIEVHERILPPPMYPDDDAPCNIVAAADGKILAMEVFDGETLIAPGDVVAKGDLLVSGIFSDQYGKITMKHARAKIYAQVQYQIEVEIPLEQVLQEHTGEIVTRYSFRLFGLEIPLFLRGYSGDADCFTDRTPLRILWFELPMEWISREYRPYAERNVSYTEQQAKAIALRELEERRILELAGCEIYGEKTVGFAQDGVFRLRALYNCRMNIAEEQFIPTAES